LNKRIRKGRGEILILRKGRKKKVNEGKSVQELQGKTIREAITLKKNSR
jgi:hypothetical protein